jgi:hypothetical protein
VGQTINDRGHVRRKLLMGAVVKKSNYSIDAGFCAVVIDT